MPISDQNECLILDTHVWIWLMEGNPCLNATVRTRIQHAVTETSLQVSAISVWEIALLESKGRIAFSEECRIWVQRALAAPGIELTPLTPDIAIESTRLPSTFHGDPADRIIAATARACGGTLVTADKAILNYAKQGHLRVLAAR
jgi:PIN domain nuclease of toxin-antitoxin system